MKTEPWYQEWFGQEYLKLYNHRNDAQAAQEVSLILNHVPLALENKILDVACGRGRHLAQFLKQDYRNIAGTDLSSAALQVAQEDLPQAPCLIQADMRFLPFSNNSFSLLLSLFNSFGYFENDEAHQQLLDEWYRVTIEDGCFVLDYFNRDYTLAHLTPHSQEIRGAEQITQQRNLSVDQKRILKEISIENRTTGEVTTFRESVRLYSPDEISRMVEKSGFAVTQRYGGFEGGNFTKEAKQLIIFARKTKGKYS